MTDQLAQLAPDRSEQNDGSQNPEQPAASPMQPDTDGITELGDQPATEQALPPIGEPATRLDSAEPAASAWSSFVDRVTSIQTYDFESAYQLLERGGPVVAIIGVLSVVSLAVIFLKGFQFFALGIGRGRGLEAALASWFEQDRELALSLLARRRNPAAKVLRHSMSGLSRGIGEAFVREDAERVALGYLASLRRYLRILESTAQIAPLLGLFGTVIGMMSAFQVLHSSGADTDPAALAGGIWVALITTCVGLAVAIPASFALYWFESRIDREKAFIESSQTSLFTHRLSNPAIGQSGDQTLLLTASGARHAAE